MNKSLIAVFCLVLATGIWAGCFGARANPEPDGKISGTVTGLDGNLVLEINNGNYSLYIANELCSTYEDTDLNNFTHTISKNGDWETDGSYYVDDYDSWEITILQQPDGQKCSLSKTEGNCGNATKDDVNITCTPVCPDLTTPTTTDCANGLSEFFDEPLLGIDATVVTDLGNMTGGTITDGIYKTTALESTASGSLPVQYLKFISCGDEGTNMIVENFIPGFDVKEKWMYQIDGTTITTNRVCPSQDGPNDWEFTATETEFIVIAGNIKSIFTKLE